MSRKVIYRLKAIKTIIATSIYATSETIVTGTEGKGNEESEICDEEKSGR